MEFFHSDGVLAPVATLQEIESFPDEIAYVALKVFISNIIS